MTIKARLILTFSVFIALILFIGGNLFLFSYKNKAYVKQNLNNYARLLFWQEIYHSFDIQWRSLNDYKKSTEQEHLNVFWEQDAFITDKSKYLPSPREAIDDWMGSYIKLTGIVKGLKRPGRSTFTNEDTKSIVQVSGDLHSKLKQIISNLTDTIGVVEMKIANLNRLSMVLAFCTSFLALVIGGIMSFVIFRAIIHPLNVIQRGTKMVGEGNMDYQITLGTKDEIGQLAESFNSMITNLRTLQLQIVQMDRMSSIGQLAGGVAHEINNPLTGVLGQAQLLLEKLPADSPYKKTVERIESAAQRCRSIVRALLDFAREKNYKFLPTDINELVNETLEFTKSEMNSKKIVVEKDIPDPMPSVQVSAGHIQQVFLNLINNAIHAMPKGGRLLISASMVENNVFEITFTDSGIGIKKENVGHVFDPFFTTKDIGKGTGLGLTISYGIIKRHKGEIFVKSDGEGKGATFGIRLPISHEAQDDKERVAQIFSTPVDEKEIIIKKETRY